MATVQPQSRKPTHEVFHVKGDGENSIWMKIGAAWANRDGEGYSVSLELMPIGSGRLMMRKVKPKTDAVPVDVPVGEDVPFTA